MTFTRWQSCFTLLLIWFSCGAYATIYSAPSLNEAAGLIDISPAQAKKLTSEYLQNRRLTDKAEKAPNTIARDETDTRIRTPGSTVDALQLLAQAEFNLGNALTAYDTLDHAEKMTHDYQLPYLHLDVKLLQAKLHWLDDESAANANERIDKIEKQFKQIKNSDQLAAGVNYKLTMLRAEVASKADQTSIADKLFDQAKSYLNIAKSTRVNIDYHLLVGQHYLNHERYNLALSELLKSYWDSIESDSGAMLAKTNALLGRLFFERQVLDKALVHLSQAADFYGKYDKSPLLAKVLKRMGDTYFLQSKFNLALVHYFNVIDHETSNSDIADVIETRLSLASTYLQLYNYPLADQYLKRAEELLSYSDIPLLKAKVALLNAGLAFHQKQTDDVIKYAIKGLQISRALGNKALEEQAYLLLSQGYEQSEQYALALQNMKYHNHLSQLRQEKLNRISEDAFRQQKEFVEQTLHMAGQEQQLKKLKQEYSKFQKIAFGLFITSALFFLLLLRRGYVIQRQKDEIEELNSNLFTHSRSRLRNLRMLNARLATSLEKSSRSFEEWHIGELINEPLNDRLRFVMIDIPFMRNMYLQHGYIVGLELEHAFGAFLKSKLNDDQRIYHFSDSNLLYIETNTDRNRPPEEMFEQFQAWIDEFEPHRHLNRNIRVGVADYPFLPRAYTAIDDKELLDILLMATDLARGLSLLEDTSQWVYFKAIDNAPAASFASNNIRRSCKYAINQGLVKIQSSYKNEETLRKLLKEG
ncbi:tetratricopeptide repeat protein [Vibrio sp. CAIM 722]|uniref:Tetratricopeptide repeat protein n=1 Tax=Vibrio eleionomae TaxID=2653505 RepID=A0A7X4LKD8_9VIBR|nr:tetratricopeptide repeat protein [Vibrio eleionomae]MZI93524.1 tetratricopeptide repeat protein [Vibrio eleionomae]